MRVAIYARVSTNQQVQAQTIDQQIERLTRYCADQSWSCLSDAIFRDDGYSGAALDRPGLSRLRQQIAQATYDCILITSPDRLARNYIHQMLLIEECARVGCEIRFLDQPIGQTPHEQLLVQIRSAVAEYERSVIVERLRRGRHYKYQQGTLLPWTTPAPFGYRVDPDHPRSPAGVTCDLVTAPIIHELFLTYLEPHQSLASLAKWLTDRHIPTATGQRIWRAASIRAILRNPVYKGEVYAGREQSRDIRRRRSPLTNVGKRTRSQRRVPANEWLFVAHVPAIVTTDVWDAVQAKLATNQLRARRNNTAHEYLLRALVSCGTCRMACAGRVRRTYMYYVCAGKAHPVRSSRTARCTARTIPARQLEDLVWNDLCAVLMQPDHLREAMQQAHTNAWGAHELRQRQERLEQATAQLESQRERLTDAYLASVLGLDEYTRRRRQLDERLAGLVAQQHQLTAQLQQSVELVHAKEIDPAYQRQLSVFQLGWRLLHRLVSCSEPPSCTLQLRPFRPEPVWRGKC